MSQMSIIGRERALVNKLTKALQETVAPRHEYTKIVETSRGASFEALLFEGGESTGRVVRVTVELDRVL